MIEHFLTALQGFCAGGIAMAYVSNYNAGNLEIAIIFLILSILFRISNVLK